MGGLSVGIFGASGQIGRCLTRALAADHDLSLFARRPGVVHDFLDLEGLAARVATFDGFAGGDYDLIINAVGNGDPAGIRREGAGILETTAHFDDLALGYLRARPETGYLFLSTGAIYGEDYRQALEPEPVLRLPLNRATPKEFYPLAKRIAEIKHRTASDLKVSDIRIFGFVSRALDPQGGFFLSQVLQKLLADEVFETGASDFVRDYASSDDLVRLVRAIVENGVPNREFDLYSAAPTTKAGLLEAMKREFGLRVEIGGSQAIDAVQTVPPFITAQRAAETVGYRPAGTSLQNVLDAVREIFAARGGQGDGRLGH